MTKYAFKLRGSATRALTVDADSLEVSRLPVSLAAARRQGYTLLDWPTDFFGHAVHESELLDHLPEAPATNNQADPAFVAKLERAARIAGAAPGAGFDIAMTLAATDLPEDKARGFLRGLPAAADLETTTTTTNEKDTDMQLYRNQPEDARSKQRAVEIKLASIANRASTGDPVAAKKQKEINYCRSVAASTGKSLFAVLAEMNVSLA